MSWLFSQALAEEYLPATCSDGEPYAQLNVMPTPHKFWRNDKTMDASSLSRFGLTLRLLTEDRGKELLTLFRADFPVRTLASQEQERASMENEAGSGESLKGWYAKYDRDSSSWKTAQRSLVEGLELYSETWPNSGLMLNGKCYLAPTVERTTSERESGLLPTLTVCGNYNKKGASKTSGDGLATALKKLPTLCARDHRHPGRSRLERTGGKQGENLPQVIGGPLNPMWCEWFMGFPLGWTALEPLGMRKFQEWQQQHSPNCVSEAA